MDELHLHGQGCKRGGAVWVLEFPFPSPSVNAIPISVPIPAAGIIFFSVPVPMDLYLKSFPPYHPSKVSNKHITKVSNKNTCLKQKYFNINSKSFKVNQFRIISSLSNSISHSHPHPRGGYKFYTRPRPMTHQIGTHPRPDGTGMGRVSYQTRPDCIPSCRLQEGCRHSSRQHQRLGQQILAPSSSQSWSFAPPRQPSSTSSPFLLVLNLVSHLLFFHLILLVSVKSFIKFMCVMLIFVLYSLNLFVGKSLCSMTHWPLV